MPDFSSLKPKCAESTTLGIRLPANSKSKRRCAMMFAQLVSGVLMRQFLIATFLLLTVSSSLSGQHLAWQPPPGHPMVDLWPNDAPDLPANSASEVDTTTAKDNLISSKPLIRLGNVSKPTLTYYAAQAPNSGAAVVVFPGGAYHILAIDLEGTEVCDWLITIHVNCIVVKYRVPDSGPLPKSTAALQDAQRALGIVRSRAAEWHIDPRHIGVLGFSAGAHLSAALSTHFDKRLYDPVDTADQLPCRPDFAVIVYPGDLALAEQNFAANPEIHVTADTPGPSSSSPKTIPSTSKIPHSIFCS